MRVRKGRYPFIFGFLLAPVVVYVVFVISPYAQTFYYSLTDWKGFSGKVSFVGLSQYSRILHDTVFWTALRHNLLMLVLLPPVTIALALFFAFMLNAGGRANRAGVRGVAGSGLYKALLFFPQVLPITTIAVLWQQIYRTDGEGPLNRLLIAVGLVDPKNPILWLSDTRLVLWCVMFVMLWSTVGFYLVLFSAAMSGIPREIYESALLDGAGRVHAFRHVTLPLLRDHVQMVWVYVGIAALDGFTYVFVMTPEQGGPNHASEVMGTWIYYNAFTRGEPAYGAAMAVAMCVVVLTLSVVSLRLTRRERVEL
jgi:N-acetylglucosamine transport system permease protein